MTHLLLFGGSFDPPTLAHVSIAREAMKQTHAGGVIFMPAAQSPLKESSHTDNAHRLAMLTLATADEPWASISTLELERGGTSYTIETVETLLEEGVQVQLLIGADQWSQFPHWHRHEALIELGNPVVIPRNGIDVPPERRLHIEPIVCSSTDARNAVKSGQPTANLLNAEVAKYIETHGLYV